MLQELLQKVKEQNPNIDLKLVERAYIFCKKSHENQKRATGELYYTHPVAVAMILADSNCSTNMICAALLHDVVEDTAANLEEVEKEFGKEVALLVDGVTENKKVKNWKKRRAQFHRKILDIGSDHPDVYDLKFADILHNIRTINARGKMRSHRYAKEVLTFYVPLAKDLDKDYIALEFKEKAEEILS